MRGASEKATGQRRKARSRRVTDHYSGHDPETGCGIMILGLALLLGTAALAVAYLLGVGQ